MRSREGAVTGDEWAMDGGGPAFVPLPQIIASTAYQIREKLDGATVKRYATAMRAGVRFPPVVLTRIDGGEGLFLIDGHHRYRAAQRAGMRGLEAEIRDLTPSDAGWEAAKANLQNGLPLRKRKEVRAVFDAYMAARRYRKGPGGRGIKSLREISADLGGIVSHSGVARWLKRDHRHLWDHHFRGEAGDAGDGAVDHKAIHERQCLNAAREAIDTLKAALRPLPRESREGLLRDLDASLRGDPEGAAGGDEGDEF